MGLDPFRLPAALLPFLFTTLLACPGAPSISESPPEEFPVGVPLIVYTWPGDTTLTVGDAVQYAATTNVDGEHTFTWRSFDSTIVSVSRDGLARGLSLGEASLLVTMTGSHYGQGQARVRVVGQ